MSIHSAPSGRNGATISWWRLPPENTFPFLMTSKTSGGKKGCGLSDIPITTNLIITFNHLQIASRFQLFCIIKGEDSVAQGGSQIATSFATLDDDFGNVFEGFHHVF